VRLKILAIQATVSISGIEAQEVVPQVQRTFQPLDLERSMLEEKERAVGYSRPM